MNGNGPPLFPQAPRKSNSTVIVANGRVHLRPEGLNINRGFLICLKRQV